jgi:hypothetical protein
MILSISTIVLGAAALMLYWLVRRTESTAPIDWRGVLARLPLPMLALAASYGVYSFARLFVPDPVAIIQAAAFELTYIGLAVTRTLDRAQRKRATLISIGAVVASIVYNTLAGWFHRQPELLSTGGDIAWLMLAILHGAPLAWVAYLVADLLLHSQPKPLSRRPAQLRALVRRLARGWQSSRAALTPLEAMLAQSRVDLEGARAMLAQQGAQLAQELIEAAQLRTEAVSARAEQIEAQHAAAHHHAEATRLTREQEQSRREFDQVAMQLREELGVARAAAGLDVLAVARRLVKADVPLREIAAVLGLAESTLRGRLKAATNGHAIEAE